MSADASIKLNYGTHQGTHHGTHQGTHQGSILLPSDGVTLRVGVRCVASCFREKARQDERVCSRHSSTACGRMVVTLNAW